MTATTTKQNNTRSFVYSTQIDIPAEMRSHITLLQSNIYELSQRQD